MTEEAATLKMDELFDAYAAAALAFNAASSVLIFGLARGSIPTGAEIATEEVARAAVVATRAELWAAYERRRNSSHREPHEGNSMFATAQTSRTSDR
jgi:hypothetical protein